MSQMVIVCNMGEGNLGIFMTETLRKASHSAQKKKKKKDSSKSKTFDVLYMSLNVFYLFFFLEYVHAI